MFVVDNNLSENKKDHYGGKKRAFSSINDNFDQNLSNFKSLKKKKFVKESSATDLKQNDPKFLQYEVSESYTKVSANPELLPKTPKIFNMMQPNRKPNNSSGDFLLDLITVDCFNTDTSARFTNIDIDHNLSLGRGQEDYSEKQASDNLDAERNGDVEQRGKYLNSKQGKRGKDKGKKQREDANDSFDSDDIPKKKEIPVNLVDTYKGLKEKALVFHMHHPSTFSFHGEIKVTLIIGEVDILGYTLTESSDKKSVNVYSPNFCTALTVETKEPRETNSEEKFQKALADVLSEDDIKILLTKVKPLDSLLLIEQNVSSFGVVINKYLDRPIFSKDLEDVSSLSETVKSLQSTFTFSTTFKKAKQIRKNREWDNIPLGQCTVLCGGKGVGKSTLLRYFINRLVSQGEKALCLDFDPGQPEFSIPGSVSAAILSEPLLGPNFTHVIEPEILVYYGEINVSQDPSKFLEYINYVLEYCKKKDELQQMKWFVNTMGFCKGLGVDLMITTLKLLKPDTVIQIKCSDFKNNYPFYMTATNLNSRPGFRSMPLNVSLFYDFRVINTCATRCGKPMQGGLTPKQLRDIMTLSYFSKMTSPPFYNFNAIQPYLISFSKLYLGIDSLISLNDVLKAFNGNVVSLSQFEPESEEVYTTETEENEYFKIVIKPRIVPCLGVGFVRGIDCAEKKFYVMTHLPAEELEKVNCLSLGKIGPPHCMFLKQDQIEGQAVYTSLSTFDIVQKVKRMFRVPEHLK